ncbi:MAG: hypothetical protein R2729_21155 [Bryobacteraceae bacterium]
MFVGADEIRWYQDVQIAHEKLTVADEKIEANGLTYHLHFAVKVEFYGENGLYFRPDAKTIRKGVPTAQAAQSYKVEYIDPSTIKFTPWNVHNPAGDAVTMKRDNLIGGLKGGSGNVDLQRGVKYYSPNGQYYFEWQKDGNFVLKKTSNGEFRWGMNLVRKDFGYIKIMRLQPTGNLVARGGEGPGDVMWAALKGDPGPTQLIATDDGKLQLRLISTGSHLWSVP